MVCIFCIAVLLIVGGALTSAKLDDIEVRLAATAKGEQVRRAVDTDSVLKFELTVQVGAKEAPVAVTIYKDHKRVRIQILTHDLTAEEVEQLEDTLAEALDAKIVERSDPVHEASPEHAAKHAAEAEREKDKVENERVRDRPVPRSGD
jgi:hypothetical protein